MKQAVQKQVQLPLSRAAEIAWRSLRVRMGRSALTLLTIVMAIAFLSNVWTTRVIAGAAAAATAEGTTAGGAARTVWLLSLSLLVCLVGIANAMLMSVMERFREIGTMKCLGALDSFILRVFFLESLMLGATGSVAGALLGELMTLLFSRPKSAAGDGFETPWGTLWGVGAASVGIGLLITAAAALYPAWRAARMEPIAAMRVEV